ncbi:MAG: hypothetical protein HY742_09455 [Deltaproteobacteria bacterium]|nr:hypothetical protein [Deltaproteobacteria bacterium]
MLVERTFYCQDLSPVARYGAWKLIGKKEKINRLLPGSEIIFEFDSKHIPRSLLRGKRTNVENYYSLRIEASPQNTAESFNGGRTWKKSPRLSGQLARALFKIFDDIWDIINARNQKDSIITLTFQFARNGHPSA